MARAFAMAAVGAILGVACVRPGLGADGAVILMYHHVDTGTPASTSVSPGSFRAHMTHLSEGDFNVAPLLDVLTAVDEGRPLPDRTVVITFDDAYESVMTAALPELERRDWPFTVFVNSDAIDSGYRGYLSWDDLRELAARGATIGNHTESHAHLVRRREGERAGDWSARVRAEIEGAGGRLAREVGEAYVPVLAYPYGEYDDQVRAITAELGLYGVGQHSGAVGPTTDLLAAPRFPQATGYDSIEEFASRVRARALPASYQGSPRHVVDGRDRSPALELELERGDYRAGALACYATGQGRIEASWLNADRTRLRITPNEALGTGRIKYNCTAPSASESGVFYWFSHLWIVPRADGSWYEG